MDIDPDRWQALLAAHANACDVSPSIMLLQEAHGRASQAQSDLEQFKARGALGRRDRRYADVTASFERGVDELTQRVAEAEREVKRLDALQRQSSARRNALRALLDGVRAWAKAGSLNLPGDAAAAITGLTAFAESSTRIATPSSGREFAPLPR
jgi:hypothetical protein